MSKQSIVTDRFTNLAESLKAARETSEKSRKAAEYFASVDTVILIPRGTLRTTVTTGKMEVQEFRAPLADDTVEGGVRWAVIKAKALERKTKITRFCISVDPDTGEKGEDMLLVCTIRTYEDAQGTILGVSSKNTRCRLDILAGREALRAHGHTNKWEHEYKGNKVTTTVFNANGIGLFQAPSHFAADQLKAVQDMLANLPDMSSLPE